MTDLEDKRRMRFVLMNEHPLIGYALSFMIGAYAAIVFSIPFIFLISMFVIAVIFSAIFIINQKKSWQFILLIFLCGGYIMSLLHLPDWYKDDYVPPEECYIAGTVESVNVTYYSSEYILKDVTIGTQKIISKILVRNITNYSWVKAGNRIRLKAVLEKPAAAQIDGMYSELRYYMTKNIQYTATVFNPQIIKLKEDSNSVKVSTKWQEKIFRQLNKDFDQPVLGMIFSISTGNKDYMDEVVYSRCAELGIAHIFAVSGLHIGALLILWEFYCRKSKKRFLARILGSVILIAILFFAVGSRASLLRAIVMWALVVIYHYSGVKGDIIDFLSLAVIALLFINPLYVIDLGFILSVTCVSAIAVVYVPFMEKRKKSRFVNSYPVSLFLVSLAILSFSWVITAKFFNQVAVFSPFWNVVFVPLAVVLLSLILCYAIVFYLPILNTVIIFFIDSITKLIIWLVKLGSLINIDIKAPDISFFASAAVILVLFLMTDTIVKGMKKIRIMAGLIIIAGILLIDIVPSRPDGLEVFAGYDSPFIFIKEKDSTLLLLNQDDGGIERVLDDINENEIDLFIYSGNDAEDLNNMLINIENVKFKNIIVHKDLLIENNRDEPYYCAESGENINFGNIIITLNEFRANKNAITHYYADINYYENHIVYLDPLRLREGAIEDCDIAVSSNWTKQRIENVVFAGADYVIMNSQDYLMGVLPSLDDGTTVKTYNINNNGVYMVLPQGE